MKSSSGRKETDPQHMAGSRSLPKHTILFCSFKINIALQEHTYIHLALVNHIEVVSLITWTQNTKGDCFLKACQAFNNFLSLYLILYIFAQVCAPDYLLRDKFFETSLPICLHKSKCHYDFLLLILSNCINLSLLIDSILHSG